MQIEDGQWIIQARLVQPEIERKFYISEMYTGTQELLLSLYVFEK